jgi:ubiquinone/menaquinone biosynthesis C-methylase UbiE
VSSKELYPAVFSRHAEAYKSRLDEVMARGEARGRLRMLELSAAAPGMTVLDLACGPGNITRLLDQRVEPGGRVLGVDLARGMIELAARDHLSGTSFAVMDIERLGLSDQVFDAVACGHGLQFAPDLDRALREAWRVLRPTGTFAASVPVAGTDDSVWRVIDRVIDRHLPPAPKAVDDSATRATVSDPDTFRAAALGAGFASASVEVVDEQVHWDSAEMLVARCMSWWQFAARVDAVDAFAGDSLMAEATEAVRQGHPGPITTHSRNLVLVARRN